MRRLVPILAICAAAAPASQSPPAMPLYKAPSTLAAPDCPDATNHLAGRKGSWERKPLKPQRLGELPPADAYAAVYRRDERGCMVPVMFRDIRKPRSSRR